jgi:hypothetical protein
MSTEIHRSEKVQQAFSDDSDSESEDYDEDDKEDQGWHWQYVWQNEASSSPGCSLHLPEQHGVTSPNALAPEETFSDFDDASIFEGR